MKNDPKAQSRDPQAEAIKLAQAVEKVMESLASIMDQETALLAKQNVDGLNALREEKTRLVRDYQLNISVLAQKPELLKEAPADVRDRLRKVGVALEVATKQNALKLQAAISTTQALVQTVIDAARDGTKHTDCYSDPRKSPLMLGSYSPLCLPVAVNRTA